MAKASTVAVVETGKSVTETITYVPGPMDPPMVKWGGHVFQANMPKEISGHPDGTEREKLNHEIIEAARGNKHFLVGDAKKKREPLKQPKTAEEYRAYFVAWLADPALDGVEKLVARFAQDHDLQTMCEVGADDWSYLGSLFMPKLSDLAKADELTEQQVAQVWLRHGINQLPW